MNKILNRVLGYVVLALLMVAPINSFATAPITGDHFSVKEYNDFHHVLHPLQHEALPKKDYATIRARSGELVTLGEAIVKVGVPANVNDVPGFTNELKKFSDSLVKFKTDSANATDAQLVESYLAVHDTFEMLAAMLPRK
jgi:hypothetical protein